MLISNLQIQLVTQVFIIGAGLASLIYLAKKSNNDKILVRIAVGSFLLRVFISFFFFYVSFWQLPIFLNLQSSPGFWAIAPDSAGYHYYAQKILESWRQGIELPYIGTDYTFYFYTSFIYQLFGPHPLNPVLINSLYGALSAVLAYKIVLLIGGNRKTAIFASLLIGFFPSSIIWSSLLLKDSLHSLSILAMLYLLIWLLIKGVDFKYWRRSCIYFLFLGVIIFVSYKIRYYSIICMLLSVTGVLGGYGIWRLTKKDFKRVMGCITIISVYILFVLLAKSIDLKKLLTPSDIDIGYYMLSLELQKSGNYGAAINKIERSLSMRPNFPIARANLAQLYSIKGKQKEAIEEANKFFTYVFREKKLFESSIAFINKVLEAAKKSDFKTELLQTVSSDSVNYSITSEALKNQANNKIKIIKTENQLLSNEVAKRLRGEIVLRVIKTETNMINSLVKEALSKRDYSTSSKRNYFISSKKLFDNRKFLKNFKKESLLKEVIHEVNINSLGSKRGGFLNTPGYSNMDVTVKINGIKDIILFTPKAIANVLLSPFPWQWIDTHGSTGIFRLLSAFDAIVLYFLFLPGIWMLKNVIASKNIGGILVLFFSFGLLYALGLVVANLGTLFRLRLQALLPFFILVSLTDPICFYKNFLNSLQKKVINYKSLMIDKS